MNPVKMMKMPKLGSTGEALIWGEAAGAVD
jgi:hypothetical protein